MYTNHKSISLLRNSTICRRYCIVRFKMKLVVTTLLLLFSIQIAVAQSDGESSTLVESEATNKEQAAVPTTLAEAHAQLEKQLPEEELRKIDAMKSEDDMIEYHFGLGMGIRNSWGLWGPSPLAEHMRELGFTHADDMSSVILETFWCKRHGKDFRIKEQADYCKAYWAQSRLPDEKVVDPADNSKVKWTRAYSVEGPPYRVIYIGRSKASGRLLAFEHTTGVYVPDEKLLQYLREPDRIYTEYSKIGEAVDPLPELDRVDDHADRVTATAESQTEGN